MGLSTGTYLVTVTELSTSRCMKDLAYRSAVGRCERKSFSCGRTMFVHSLVQPFVRSFIYSSKFVRMSGTEKGRM